MFFFLLYMIYSKFYSLVPVKAASCFAPKGSLPIGYYNDQK